MELADSGSRAGGDKIGSVRAGGSGKTGGNTVTGRAGGNHAGGGDGLLLALDVGNTSTHAGVFAGDNLLGTYELTTPGRLTADEAQSEAERACRTILERADVAATPSSEHGRTRMGSSVPFPAAAILSCVVPALTDPWTRALAGFTGARPLVVGPGLKTGLKMRYDDPAEVGADRVADAVAVQESHGAPAIVVDLGTTTNFEVIDKTGAFLGGVIAPGIALGAASLARAAARLPQIALQAPRQVIGKNTRSAMQAGVVLGEAARIDGLLDAIADELGYEPPIILTGNDAPALAALLRHEVAVDATLTLRGLRIIYQRNRR